MRFLISGATGFIGANLARRLVHEGCRDVHLLTRKSSNRWRIDDIRKRLHDHRVDLRDPSNLKRIVKSIRPQIIFHCAIYGGYPFQKDKDKIWDTNLNGTINLIRALEAIPYKSLVNIGSSSEYGVKTGPMKEDDLLRPTNLYGLSKAAATIFACQAAMLGKRPITTVRPFSVFGPYEEATRLVPSIIDACLKGREIVIRSPGSVRDYVYIDDAVDFLLKAASKKKALGILNLGGGRQRSVREIVKIIERVAKKKIKARYGKVRRSPLEPDPWIADMTKAKRLLGWRVKTRFEDGIKKTIEWMR